MLHHDNVGYNFLEQDNLFLNNKYPKHLQFLQNALSKHDPQKHLGFDIFLDYRGVKVIGAYFWLKDRKLALIAKQDASEAFKPIDVLGKRIFVFVICVAIIVFCISYIFIGRITRLLQTLLQGAEAIGNGDLDFRIETTSMSEFGTLSNAFDQMAENLKLISISRDEKDVLLTEIYHRVKNNMQVIVSLLNLQADKVEDKRFSAMLQESQNRIKAMSLVHEKLYQSKDLANIDFGDYVKTFVDSLAMSHGIDPGSISFITDIEDVYLDLENAIPCGLIINELVSNCVKYAFPDEKTGEIRITLNKVDEEDLALTIKDNGTGLPENFDINTIKTLGLNIAKTIVEHQLDGTIYIDKTEGTSFHILFKRLQYKARL